MLAEIFVAGTKYTAASLALLQEKPYLDAGGRLFNRAYLRE